MVNIRVIVLGLQIFLQKLKLCHDEKPCTWWLGVKGLGSLKQTTPRSLTAYFYKLVLLVLCINQWPPEPSEVLFHSKIIHTRHPFDVVSTLTIQGRAPIHCLKYFLLSVKKKLHMSHVRLLSICRHTKKQT